MSLKYVEEYRDAGLAKELIKQIHKKSRHPLRLMEVCGTHTMSIFRHGIRTVLPETITLLTGPGCPVCVTAQKDIDAFVALAGIKDCIVTTFGDLMRVPGSGSSLMKEKAEGRDVRIVYSIFDAVKVAVDNPDQSVVFCAVGFETTIPTVAAAILAARQQELTNFFIHSAHKLTPPALAALMTAEGVEIDGFLLPGHVSVITGTDAYRQVFDTYQVPSVIAGFEPVDILKAVLMLVEQNEANAPLLENAYPRAVSDQGNVKAKTVMNQVFEPSISTWRGLGEIPGSGMRLREAFRHFDALDAFGLPLLDAAEPKGCSCGEILMGLKTPMECALFKKRCTPSDPIGPCMVSSEGACAAFYRYST